MAYRGMSRTLRDPAMRGRFENYLSRARRQMPGQSYNNNPQATNAARGALNTMSNARMRLDPQAQQQQYASRLSNYLRNPRTEQGGLGRPNRPSRADLFRQNIQRRRGGFASNARGGGRGFASNARGRGRGFRSGRFDTNALRAMLQRRNPGAFQGSGGTAYSQPYQLQSSGGGFDYNKPRPGLTPTFKQGKSYRPIRGKKNDTMYTTQPAPMPNVDYGDTTFTPQPGAVEEQPVASSQPLQLTPNIGFRSPT